MLDLSCNLALPLELPGGLGVQWRGKLRRERWTRVSLRLQNRWKCRTSPGTLLLGIDRVHNN